MLKEEVMRMAIPLGLMGLCFKKEEMVLGKRCAL
jgi:hypothetical protein